MMIAVVLISFAPFNSNSIFYSNTLPWQTLALKLLTGAVTAIDHIFDGGMVFSPFFSWVVA